MDGTDASENVIPGDTTNGLDVDVTRMPRATASSVTAVSVSTTSVAILAANTGRQGVIIANDGGTDLLVKFGATASATSYTLKLSTGAYVVLDRGYTGTIDAIRSTGTGNVMVTEMAY